MELTSQNFEEEIKEGKVLVDFYAVWCGPCRMMHPIIDEVEKHHPELKVIKVNVDQKEEIARQYGIMSIPTIILFENGEMKKRNVGFTSQEVIEDWLTN